MLELSVQLRVPVVTLPFRLAVILRHMQQYEGYWSNDNINGNGTCTWERQAGERRQRYQGR